ncbi:hypothetical protein C1645_879077 [Glomus cerebriforme]|uniref:Uncharacterized protein n=1 Tax=Glomus cerebriforme TaxID=658196 RepID=A0A397SMG2_9GLOM|nr:hypothetical protein C1645_879077 [Glomus cerebriforme]
MIKPKILAENSTKKILTILNGIIKDEDNEVFINYPVLIGSRAAKWHIPSFRESNDWDLVATILQSTLFIDKLMSSATFKDIKLIYYPGCGLKMVGECIESHKNRNSIKFDIELVSDKVDLRKMKPNEFLAKMEEMEDNSDYNDDDDDVEMESDEDDEDDSDYNDDDEDDETESDEDDSDYSDDDNDDEVESDKDDLNNNDDISDEVKSNKDDSDNNDNDDSEKVKSNKDNSNNEDDEDKVENVDKIEFEKFSGTQPEMSAIMILKLCCNVKDITLFPLSSNFPCIVAPLKVLEALKSSHIYWPTNFQKNIADLHTLRVILDNNKSSMNEPLRSPQRDELIELMIKTRIKETELRQGIPGSHINLNMTNEEFLDYKDDLFVQRRVLHDELHELVKYGDCPIYDSLKDDKSKAWVKQSLFQKIDYQTQLNCVREEAMVIALERYLIPMISKNQETSYNLALNRICTTLTKGWFRQFAVDNYPRILNLDKDLLSIAHDIIDKHPLKQKKSHASTLDPETQAFFEYIRSYTKVLTLGNFINDEYRVKRSGIKINSPVNDDNSITVVITTVCKTDMESCTPNVTWSASVVILPSEDLEFLSNDDKGDEEDECYKDPFNLHPCYYGYDNTKFKKLTSKHIYVVGLYASGAGGSWSIGSDVWGEICVRAKSADYIANKLEIPEFTGDLLFKYVLDYLKPSLENNGDTPLKAQIDNLKAKGDIPIEPQYHLWYYVWNNALKTGNWKISKKD